MISQHSIVEALGWAATATFVGSYFAKRPATLIRAQIVGALMWAVYGTLVHSAPVIAANVLVLGAAAWKARSTRERDDLPSPGAASPGVTPIGQ